MQWSTSLRDWSLISGRGGTKREGGGHLKVYHYEKGGGFFFSHAEGAGGGVTKSFGVVFMQ